jgi:hypothetical protein
MRLDELDRANSEMPEEAVSKQEYARPDRLNDCLIRLLLFLLFLLLLLLRLLLRLLCSRTTDTFAIIYLHSLFTDSSSSSASWCRFSRRNSCLNKYLLRRILV